MGDSIFFGFLVVNFSSTFSGEPLCYKIRTNARHRKTVVPPTTILAQAGDLIQQHSRTIEVRGSCSWPESSHGNLAACPAGWSESPCFLPHRRPSRPSLLVFRRPAPHSALATTPEVNEIVNGEIVVTGKGVNNECPPSKTLSQWVQQLSNERIWRFLRERIAIFI